MKHFFTTFLILLSLLGITQFATAQDWIPDKNLRRAVREELQIAQGRPLWKANMANLTSLSKPKGTIYSLTGLEHATNLTKLIVWQNNISDISPLAGLTSITEIRIGGNTVADISPLANLTNLTRLAVQRNGITDISVLSNLVNLQWLRLAGNPITDFSALAGLQNLTDVDVEFTISVVPDPGLAAAIRSKLELAETEDLTAALLEGLTTLTASAHDITDLTGLEHATNLTTLDISSNTGIRDITVLSGLTNLMTLDISDNGITNLSDVTGLSDMTHFTTLKLDRNQIADVTPLASLTNLITLSLADNQITDISSLPALTQLIWLHLGNNQITDVTPLGGMTHLKILRLAGNPIEDTQPLVNHSFTSIDIQVNRNVVIPDEALRRIIQSLFFNRDQITRLDLNNLLRLHGLDAGITDLTGLEYAHRLKELYLRGNQISDLSPLRELTHLVGVFLGSNQISDLSALQGLSNLTALSLENNQISDLSALQGLSNLTTLSLENNQISDLSALQGLSNLTALSLENNQISDLSALQGLTHLTTLSLENNQISDLSALQGLSNLTALSLENNQISDLSALQGLSNLTTLSLENNQIVDISALQSLTNLRVLNIANNQIVDIAPLQGLTTLEELTFEGNSIADRTPLLSLNITFDENIVSGNPYVHDYQLELALRSALDLSEDAELTPDNIAQLETLTLPDSDADVTTLTGLEYATALTELHASGNAIVDLTPLSNLTLLTTVDLANNQIWNLAPLSDLTLLTALDLANNQIQGVYPLAGLVNLETLTLEGNQIQDTSPLLQLTATVDIELVETVYIPDRILRAFIQLKLGLNKYDPITASRMRSFDSIVDLDDPNLSDLTGLEYATNLTILQLRDKQISDISPLAGLTNLQVLDLDNNQIVDVSPLAELPQLTRLKLTNNQIVDVSPLANLRTLTGLGLEGNPIDDTQPLANLTASIDIEVDRNLVHIPDAALAVAIRGALDLAADASITKEALASLTELSVDEMGDGGVVTDLTGLELATNLVTLTITGSRVSEDTTTPQDDPEIGITDITLLGELENLQTLSLNQNNIADITPIQHNENLTSLSLDGNRVTHILSSARDRFILGIARGVTTLPVFWNLESLSLKANGISDVTQLANLTSLLDLALESNNISDVSPLASLESLVTLSLRSNPILDTSALLPLVEAGLTIDIPVLAHPRHDVNQDGITNEADALLVTAAVSEEAEPDTFLSADVNLDGVVDNADLLIVTEHQEDLEPAAPSLNTRLEHLDAVRLETFNWDALAKELRILRVESDGSLKYQRAIALIEALFAANRPSETLLLANYPNPFNPETWIPYQLANSSDVQITIYDIRGTVVRHLALGHQAVGHYTTRSRAAYWDGRNAYAERVASGIYFYQLQADKVSLLRKMVILK